MWYGESHFFAILCLCVVACMSYLCGPKLPLCSPDHAPLSIWHYHNILVLNRRPATFAKRDWGIIFSGLGTRFELVTSYSSLYSFLGCFLLLILSLFRILCFALIFVFKYISSFVLYLFAWKYISINLNLLLKKAGLSYRYLAS